MTEIAEGMGISTTELRNRRTIERQRERAELSSFALRLKEKGMSNTAIGERLKLNESTVRSLLDPAVQARADILISTSNMLRSAVDKKKYIDVGAGVERTIGVSRTKLNAAISLLESEGYTLETIYSKQLGTGKYTGVKVLAAPGTKKEEISANRDQIRLIEDHTVDSGRTWYGLEPIKNVSTDRILVRYREEGGLEKDGVIELRKGVDDLDMGQSRYAQVRVGVDGTHYLKGMAIYAKDSDFPKGKDIIYNTNKPKGTDVKKVFKEMTDDPDNPFGTLIKPNGQKGALNMVYEEGDWEKWSNTISSQVLSKQRPELAKKQLKIALDMRKEEYDDIMSITNPTVKEHLLRSFAEDLDKASVDLKAAAMPRQSSKVILPLTSLKENEIYAPGYRNGENVVLIRHPHGGIFEIPELVVNNKNPDANALFHNAIDAVAIHPKVAGKLSGADFDGDSVLVIPNQNGAIKTAPSLKALKDFDTKISYPEHPGMKVLTKESTQLEMGKISNLITDMTIKGASHDEIARAVRHSMVVIDAAKHRLNYELSAQDHGIASLKKKYQGSATSGATTLISRAKSQQRVLERQVTYTIDPKTGRKIYKETGRLVPDKFIVVNGKRIPAPDAKMIRKQQLSTKMAEIDDAHKLSSGSEIESIYADHANALKALANTARKNSTTLTPIKYSPDAHKTYSQEVEQLKSALNIIMRNKPNERQAQLLANKVYAAKIQANPNLDKKQKKKIKGQALTEARLRSSASKLKIKLTPKQWEAIQMGAVSNNVLKTILLNGDLDNIREYAIPRTKYKMTDAKIAKAKAMLASGYSIGEIADAVGVSVTTINETTH
jgi:orotate phosphoribosyltransferase-like protein